MCIQAVSKLNPSCISTSKDCIQVKKKEIEKSIHLFSFLYEDVSIFNKGNKHLSGQPLTNNIFLLAFDKILSSLRKILDSKVLLWHAAAVFRLELNHFWSHMKLKLLDLNLNSTSKRVWPNCDSWFSFLLRKVTFTRLAFFLFTLLALFPPYSIMKFSTLLVY